MTEIDEPKNFSFLPRSLSILLVEDCESDCIIISKLLDQIFDKEKTNLVWVKTFDDALMAVQSEQFEVLLIDMNLGPQDGLELAQELNVRDDNTPPIIILTGENRIYLELEAISLGVSDCIFKNDLTAPLLEKAIDYSIIRKKTAVNLRTNEIRYKSILETANDGIITLDDKGRINSYNPAAEKLFGYRASEIIGRNISSLMPICIGSKHNKYLSEYLLTGVAQVIGSGREVIGLRKDGSEFPMYLSVADVGVSGAHRFSGIVRDLSMEKKTEELIRKHNQTLEQTVLERTIELEVAKDKAERADSAKTEFLANISHEIRTPLYGILSFANMGVDRALEIPSEKSKEYFRHIAESGNRLLLLLNDLLDLSKLDANKSSVNFSIENLDVIVRQCFQSEKARLEERKLTWKIFCKVEKADLEANNDGIRKIVSNLLSNAIRFSPNEGHIVASILPCFFSTDNQSDVKVSGIRFELSDEGVGVPEEEKEFIFDKFVQSSKTNTGAGGTGLGLSICKEIINIHNGKIWVENRENVGATFIFEIPLKRPC